MDRKLFLLGCALLFACLPMPTLASYGDEITYVFGCNGCAIEQQCLHDELYVGLGVIGYDAYSINQHIEIFNPLGGFVHRDGFASMGGFVNNIFIGYGRTFDWFYFAGELVGNYSHAVTHARFTGYHIKISARDGFSVNLLPGIRLNPSTLLYFRLGYVRTYFTIKERLPSLDISTSSSYWGNGYNYGVGLETAVLPKISVRNEIVYAKYGSLITPLHTKNWVEDYQFMVSVNYHIC